MKVFIFNDDDGYMAIGTPCYQPYMNDEEKDIFLIQAIQKSVPKKPDGSDRPVFIKTQEELKVADIFIDYIITVNLLKVLGDKLLQILHMLPTIF